MGLYARVAAPGLAMALLVGLSLQIGISLKDKD